MELVSPEEMPLSAAYASGQRLERQELGHIFTRMARVSLAFYLNLNEPHVRILTMDWGRVEQGKVLQDLLFSLPRVATQIHLSASQCPVSGSTFQELDLPDSNNSHNSNSLERGTRPSASASPQITTKSP